MDINFSWLIFSIYTGFDSREYYCLLEPKNENSPRIFITILYIVIPIIFIIGCYSAIFLKLRKSQKELIASLDTIENLLHSTSVSDRIRKSIEESNSRLFRMILVISACFIILIIPIMVVEFIMDKMSSFSKLGNVVKVLYSLMSANFVVNPFIYFFMNKNFREAFIKLLPEKLKNIWSAIKPNQTMELTTIEAKSTQV